MENKNKSGSKMLDETDRIFEGCFNDLPQKTSSVVRVFLSSTFTDMQSERNWLMKYALQDLKQYCQKYELEFQLVDMRWGVREDVVDDHGTTQVCLQEIKTCQKVSRGPYFVTILGDKYGYRPFPSEIESSEFKLLKNTAMKLGYDISVLLTWYLCDHNREPTIYTLQPITSMYPSYFDMSATNTSSRQQAQREWSNVEVQLSTLLRAAAECLYKEGKFTEDQKHKYFQSVTENEVDTGILSCDCIDDRVVCFQRTLLDISLRDGIAGRFTDLIDGSLDKEAEELRERSRMEKLPVKLPSNQLIRYNVPWDSMGMNINTNKKHARYIKQFGDTFIDTIKKQIQAACSDDNDRKRSPLFDEVLHHLWFATNKTKTFCGREDIIEQVHNYINSVNEVEVDKCDVEEKDDENSGNEKSSDAVNKQIAEKVEEYFKALGVTATLGDKFDDFDSDANYVLKDQLTQLPSITTYTKPLIIYGKSGSGKTALMAQIAQLSKEWADGSVTMVRFLGTSLMSTKIREVLLNLCTQIWHVYKVLKPTGLDLESDFQLLVKYFKSLLWKINTEKRPLFIILDSLDQLSPSDHAYSFHWIPQKLPPGVHVILSVVSDRLGCLDNLRLMFPGDDQFIEVGPMENNVAVDVINTFCKQSNRHLSKGQKNVVLDLFSKCSQPLYLKLLMDMSLSWKSYTVLEPTALGSTVTEAINHLFDNLERVHGEELVKKGIGYMCAAREGLTSAEIEDMLSLDDEVLQDVYIYHLPPDPSIIRLPPLLWKRVEYDIQEYIVERQSGGKNVITWYHRQFNEATRNRYLKQNMEEKFHLGLAEYFLGIWSDKSKPLTLYKGKKESYDNNTRQVPSQPLEYGRNQYNIRKISELPYHLIESNQFQKVLTDLFSDPAWLFAKCHTMSLTSLMEDFNHAEKKCSEYIEKKKTHFEAEKMLGKQIKTQELLVLNTEEEVLNVMKKISRMVLRAAESIRKDPTSLPGMLLSQLGPDYRGVTYLEKLMQSCVEWCKQYWKPLLVPTRECMMKQGRYLLYSIDIDVSLPGEKRDTRYSSVYLREDWSNLFVVKQNSQRHDDICVLDLKDNGSSISEEDSGMYIRSIRFVGNNRYILLDSYLYRNPYNPKTEHKLYESNLTSPVNFDPKPHLIDVSKSGKIIATASGNIINVYKTDKNMQVMYNSNCHEADICAVIISPDETLLVSSEHGDVMLIGKSTHKSYIHDLKSKQQVHLMSESLVIEQHSIITDKNVLLAPKTEQNGTLVLYDLINRRSLSEVKVIGEFSLDFLQLHASQEFVFVYYKNTLLMKKEEFKTPELIEISTGKKFGKCPNEHVDFCASATVFGTNQIYYALCNLRKAIVPILYAGEVKRTISDAIVIHVLIGHNQPIIELVTSSSLDIIFTVGEDNTIKVWDLKSILEYFHTEVTKIETYMIKSSTNHCQPHLGPDDNLMFDLTQVVSKYKPTIIDDRTETTTVAFNRHGDSIYVGTKTGKLLCYDVKTSKRVLTTDLNIDCIKILQLSSNGQYMIAAGRDTIHVEDLHAQKSVTLKHRGNIRCMAENNNILVAGSAGMDGEGRVWNIQTGEKLKDLDLLYSFYCVGLSKDGTKVLSSYFDYPVFINWSDSSYVNFDLDTVQTSMYSATCCSICQNDRFAAMGSVDGAVRVIDKSGKFLYFLKQRSTVVTLTFTPNGENILSAGYRSIYVWSLANGSCRYKLTRHSDFVNDIKFNTTGQFMVTVSRDKQLVLWDFDSMVSMATFQANFQIDSVDITSNAFTLAYIPDNIADLAILTVNPCLQRIMESGERPVYITPMVKAMVNTFTGNGLNKRSKTQICSVM
ncbi:hypothetical protein ACF0H5_009825 [Mactra antiquata]